MGVTRADRARAKAAVLLVTVALIGCSSTQDTVAVRPDTTDQAQPSPDLKPPGTPMIDGLVVPEGTQLAGAVFVESDAFAKREAVSVEVIEPTPDSVYPWEALLTVDGDPFKAWDDLAGQIRDTYQVEMPGSAHSCMWALANDRPRVEGIATTVEQEAEEARSQVVAFVSPPPYTVGIECHATAGRSKQGRTQRFSLSMTGERDSKPLTIHAASAWFPGAMPEVVPTAWAMSLYVRRSDGKTTERPGPDPMPAGKADQLPTFPDQEQAGPGEAFGTEVNCFITNASRMRVPDGGRFVASAGVGDLAVVAVDDLDAALEDFRLQIEGPTLDPSSEIGRWRERIPSGETITYYGHAVAVGGGYCGFYSSPDGKYVLVTLTGD